MKFISTLSLSLAAVAGFAMEGGDTQPQPITGSDPALEGGNQDPALGGQEQKAVELLNNTVDPVSGEAIRAESKVVLLVPQAELATGGAQPIGGEAPKRFVGIVLNSHENVEKVAKDPQKYIDAARAGRKADEAGQPTSDVWKDLQKQGQEAGEGLEQRSEEAARELDQQGQEMDRQIENQPSGQAQQPASSY